MPLSIVLVKRTINIQITACLLFFATLIVIYSRSTSLFMKSNWIGSVAKQYSNVRILAYYNMGLSFVVSVEHCPH